MRKMNVFSSISETYKRWRHSRGFGVHSPFAYDLVKSVVSPGNYAYYGYWDIDKAILSPKANDYPALRKDARLLLRLLVWLNSTRLLIYPPQQIVFSSVATAAGVKSTDISNLKTLKPDTGDLLVISGKSPRDGETARIIKEGTAAIAYDPSQRLRKEITEAMSNGLILEGIRILLAIPRPQMALTSYSIKF